MKHIILLIAFIGLVLSTNAQKCDTLKWKTVKTYYGDFDGSSLHGILGELDSAVINVDTVSFLLPLMDVTNISNDTFSSDVSYEFIIDFFLYADTGLLLKDHNVSKRRSLGKDFFPNDTIGFGFMAFPLPAVIDELKEKGIELEQISYWKMITGISYTSKDGTYSDSVFYAGADTVTFRVVKGSVAIVETNNYLPLRRVFPNPARSHFTVTNTTNANLYLYNMVGQEVWRAYSTDVETHCNASLPQGMYVLKVEKDGVLSTHKIVVSY